MLITYEPFWNTLKLRNMTTYTLIKKYGMSSSLIHRLRHNKPVSTVTINDLCEILECDITGIIKFKKD